MKIVPIITNEQIKTGIIIAFFLAGGLLFFNLTKHWDQLQRFPNSLWQKKMVTIRLRGAVLPPYIREVPRQWSLWQAIAHNNPMSMFIEWKNIPSAQKVYEGLDIEIPLRKLRPGEKISWNRLTKSKGLLILSLPCLSSMEKRRIKAMWKENHYSVKDIRNRLQRKQNLKCTAKYISY